MVYVAADGRYQSTNDLKSGILVVLAVSYLRPVEGLIRQLASPVCSAPRDVGSRNMQYHISSLCRPTAIPAW